MKHGDAGSPPTPPRVSRETQQRLATFIDLLGQWNRRITLVGPREMPQVWDRHIADSLQLIPLFPAGVTRAADLGSGAGFPGLVLAIATGIPFDLIEADQRKAAFLREAARVTAAPVTVHPKRIEIVSLPPVRLLTARALAPLADLLAMALPLISGDGVCLFPKGVGAEQELTQAARQWHMQVERFPSSTLPDATILRIKDLRRV